MKALIGTLSGFCLTLMVFAGGAFSALFFVTAEPLPDRSLDMDTTALWTNKAVKVRSSVPGLQRLPTANSAGDMSHEQDSLSNGGTASLAADPLTTAATPTKKIVRLSPSHVEWCFARYRSYDSSDNSYTAYSGERRQCLSPYSEPSEEEANYVEATYQAEASLSSNETTSDHVESCFERYRSYRPNDNSYQPYGGGPRLPCE